MALGSLLASFILTQTTPGSLDFKNGVFQITTGTNPISIPVDPGVVPMNTATGRLWLPTNKKVLTFDQNGLGVRANNKFTKFNLEGIPVSPKLFSKEQILANVEDSKQNLKDFKVSAISGWVKIANKAYVLARWEDKTTKPWLEALFEIDMSDPNPKPQLLGKFNGFTQAMGRVNDKLVQQAEDLAVATFTADGPAIAKFSIPRNEFSTEYLKSQNTPPSEMKLIEGSRFGVSFRKTAAKTILVGVINGDSSTHEIASEIRGSIIGIYSPTMLAYTNEGKKNITNLLTGAQLSLPNDVGISSTSQGLLLWTPKQNPTQAGLYAFGSFRTISRWQKS